jgi:nitrite reductase (cytochrome c-552)
MSHRLQNTLVLCLCLCLAALLAGCEPTKPEPRQVVTIPDGEIDPALWGRAFPEEFELWKKTEEPVSARRSKYKTGMDGGALTMDKLSHYPYMALLFNGWGFGVEYNEPRGHAYMVRDQLEIDSSRLKAGGVCLSCKSPYAPGLQEEMGVDFFRKPFKEVLERIPENNRDLGVACIDCHDNKDLSLRISRGFTLIEAFQTMGVDPAKLTRQEMRSAVCAQCHVTYNIPKDAEGKSVGLYFPWQKSTFGNISIENIIQQIRSDESVKEWTQAVTGFKMAFIRHPEYEFWTNNSTHFKAGASCADCHMPYTIVGVHKVSDHRVMSPVQAEMKACKQCHAESSQWLRERVFSIQDRTVSIMIRAGYQCATVAKLFRDRAPGPGGGQDDRCPTLRQGQGILRGGLLPLAFHGGRELRWFPQPGRGAAHPGGLGGLRHPGRSLPAPGLDPGRGHVPLKVDLEIMKYVDQRGEKKLRFDPSLEFKDPYGLQEKFF